MCGVLIWVGGVGPCVVLVAKWFGGRTLGVHFVNGRSTWALISFTFVSDLPTG